MRKSNPNKDSAKVLLAKASDDIASSALTIKEDRLHDNCGQNLAQATEKILKSLCELHSIHYSREGRTGHSLSTLFTNLQDNFSIRFVADYIDLADLDVYDSGSRYDYVDVDERLNLTKYSALCRAFFNEALREINKA